MQERVGEQLAQDQRSIVAQLGVDGPLGQHRHEVVPRLGHFAAVRRQSERIAVQVLLGV
jgi:hypothetical protein